MVEIMDVDHDDNLMQATGGAFPTTYSRATYERLLALTQDRAELDTALAGRVDEAVAQQLADRALQRAGVLVAHIDGKLADDPSGSFFVESARPAEVSLLPGPLPSVLEGPVLRAPVAGGGLLAGGGGPPLELLYPPSEPPVQVLPGLSTVWPLRDPLVDRIVRDGQVTVFPLDERAGPSMTAATVDAWTPPEVELSAEQRQALLLAGGALLLGGLMLRGGGCVDPVHCQLFAAE